MSDDEYHVAIKPSAWRASAAAGQWVNRNGATRTFASKALARAWADECSTGGVRVWVQDAVPWDADDADGYLVGRTAPPATRRSGDGDEESPGGHRGTLAGAGGGLGRYLDGRGE